MWQRNWCTPEADLKLSNSQLLRSMKYHIFANAAVNRLQVLRIYLHGRKGDVNAAAEILANTLKWREQYQDLTKLRSDQLIL